MPVIIPNPFWPQVASRGQNPESLLSGGHPGTKSFQMTPQPPFYMAWRPGFTPAIAEFNSDISLDIILELKNRNEGSPKGGQRIKHWL